MTRTIFLTLFGVFMINFSLEAIPNLIPQSDTIHQNFHSADKVVATKTEGLIRLHLTDFRKNGLGEIPIYIHNGKGQYWSGTTNAKGVVFFLLPIQARYLVNVEGKVDYRKFEIPKEKEYYKTVKVVLMATRINERESNDTIYQTLSAGMMATRSRALVSINIRDLRGMPLENEELYYNAQKSGKIYFAKTNAAGRAQLALPKGETYCVHSYAFRDITCKSYEDNEHSRTSTFELQTISTQEFKARERERQLLLAQRDSLLRLQRRRDSIQLARNENQHFYLQHRYKQRDYAAIEAKIKELARKDQAAVRNDVNYFAEAGEEIMAMFQRNKEQWPQKRIIANIDCSMYDYIDELLVWNFSDEQERANNKYWLFNGFNYKDQEAEGHSRRGIFPVVENDVEGFFNTIDKIVNFSCRGSRLENVVEALLLGAQGKSSEEDLLFIADNYSDVSDMEKLKELTVPVHVLLTASNYGVNENYLEIAYHSGGSIHTHLEDIDQQRLQALRDGEQLTIGKFQYRFLKGRFLKV